MDENLDLLTKEQVAKSLGKNVILVRIIITANEIPLVRAGNRLFVPREQLDNIARLIAEYEAKQIQTGVRVGRPPKRRAAPN